jgi:REP element-mobilizing transposase RayT
MEKNLRSRKALRLKDFDYGSKSHIYFVTLCTANRKPYFLDDRMAGIIEKEMEFRRTKKEIQIYSYCIMPDHLHLLLSLNLGFQRKLQDWVSAFKRYTAKSAYEMADIKPLWQKNFYDRIARDEESIIEIAQYIVQNPVRKGIVSNWESYPYCRIFDQ